MICPDCKGDGWVVGETKISVSPADWSYDDVKCPKCKGKGYLTPEETGLDKF